MLEEGTFLEAQFWVRLPYWKRSQKGHRRYCAASEGKPEDGPQEKHFLAVSDGTYKSPR